MTDPPAVIDVTSAALAETRAIASQLMGEVRIGMHEFVERVGWRWAAAFDAYELAVWASYDLGVRFSRRHRPRIAVAQDYRLDALIDLHARSIQVGREVLVLLGHGSADAALARWRTLHETAVVAMLLNAHDRGLAERYRLHEVIESYKAALEHERHRDALGYEPIAADELAGLKEQRDALVVRFGKPFAGPYGWAASALGKPRPTFAEIEAAVSVDHLRPYYRLASHPLHANPKALSFSLAWDEGSRIRAYAPSNSGFVDPAQSALISLAQVTAALLSAVDEREQAYWLPRYRALATLIDEAIDRFVVIQTELDAEEALVRAGRLPTVEQSRPRGLRVRVGTRIRSLLRRADEWVLAALLTNARRPEPRPPADAGGAEH